MYFIYVPVIRFKCCIFGKSRWIFCLNQAKIRTWKNLPFRFSNYYCCWPFSYKGGPWFSATFNCKSLPGLRINSSVTEHIHGTRAYIHYIPYIIYNICNSRWFHFKRLNRLSWMRWFWTDDISIELRKTFSGDIF